LDALLLQAQGYSLVEGILTGTDRCKTSIGDRDNDCIRHKHIAIGRSIVVDRSLDKSELDTGRAIIGNLGTKLIAKIEQVALQMLLGALNFERAEEAVR
jgi:hypothetical protein